MPADRSPSAQSARPWDPKWPLTIYVQPESGKVTLEPHPCERHLYRAVQVAPVESR